MDGAIQSILPTTLDGDVRSGGVKRTNAARLVFAVITDGPGRNDHAGSQDADSRS
jgi:hypothetical protein